MESVEQASLTVFTEETAESSVTQQSTSNAGGHQCDDLMMSKEDDRLLEQSLQEEVTAPITTCSCPWCTCRFGEIKNARHVQQTEVILPVYPNHLVSNARMDQCVHFLLQNLLPGVLPCKKREVDYIFQALQFDVCGRLLLMLEESTPALHGA